MVKTYAVDFDGTLSRGVYPATGEPNRELIDYLRARRAAGDKVILWTCREGEALQAAVEYCRLYDLEFDAINDNTEENKARYDNNCRKVAADFYIDDRNAYVVNTDMAIHIPREMLKEIEEGANDGK